MIYYVKKVDDKILATARGETFEVSLDFLRQNAHKLKVEEVLNGGEAHIRANWDLSSDMSSKNIESPPEKKDLKKARESFIKQFYKGRQYMLDKSTHEDLYELWRLNKRGYYNFVCYLFDIDSVPTLIREDELWEKYKKKLRKNIHEYDLDAPIGDREEDI